jgi:hypothetical protein
LSKTKSPKTILIMTQSKNLIFLFFIFVFQLNAQVNIDKKSDALPESINIASITFCKDKDHKFKVEDNFYFEGSKVYVCPRNLPAAVTVVDALPPNAPITYATAWLINGIANPSVNHTVTLNAANFMDDLATLSCTFTDNAGVHHTLELKVRKDVKLKWEDGGGVFAFDENEEIKYPGFETPITPWVFIPTNGAKTLEAKTKPKKDFYAVKNFTSSNPALNLNPNLLLEAKQDVVLNYNSNMSALIDVFGCSDVHPELKVFTQTPKMFTIEVFRLCESNDDIQVVAKGTTGLPSPTTIIISPGPDGTIDREKISVDWLKGDDTLWEDPMGAKHVVAGPNLEAETKILPHTPPGGVCPSAYDIVPTLNTLNSIYGQVSVSANNISIVDLITNFDLELDDQTLTYNEQFDMYEARHLAGFLDDDFTEVYIVEDLGAESVTIDGYIYTSTTLGRASGFFLNTLALDRTNAVVSTLPHEVGHAKYGIHHPPGEDNKTVVPIDRYKVNFMHNTSVDRTNKIRRYQFHKINKD